MKEQRCSPGKLTDGGLEITSRGFIQYYVCCHRKWTTGAAKADIKSK